MRPNWIQWVIIWAAVLVAAHLWLDLRFHSFWEDGYGNWGLPGYLRPAFRSANQAKAAFTVLVIGGLLAWQTSGGDKRS